MEELAHRWSFRGLQPVMLIGELLGGIGLLVYEVLRCIRRRWEGSLIMAQMEHIGVRSLSIVIFTAVFTGMVLALQMGSYLTRFGARPYVGRILALTLLRELGPVLTGLMIAGRVGSGITAELGSMNVTEQIDAMRSMGINPVQKLVFPRLVALLVMLPLLTVLADFVGVLGGLFTSVLELNVSASFS